MMLILRDVGRSLRASPVFGAYLLVALGVAGYVGVITLLMNVAPDVLPGALAGMSHFGTEEHRIHDVSYGAIFTVGVIGVAAQLRRPARNVAGMAMALVPWAGLLLAAVLADSYTTVVQRNPWYPLAVVVGIAALLHPSGRAFFRSFGTSRVNGVMLALVGVAAVPLVSFASTNIRLQGSVSDMHALMGHYGFMAATAFTILGVALVASLGPVGWRLTAWVAGLLAAFLGLSSLPYPDNASALTRGWALASIAWGVAFVAVAEATRAAKGPASPGPAAASTPAGQGDELTWAS
jgi:hypothetical protein